MSSWIPVGTILRVLARQQPRKEAVADLARSLTFREWNERCNRLANALLDRGLAKGDRVAFLCHNRLEWMEYYGAAAKAGLVCVPVMFRLAPREYQYILGDSGAKAFLVASEFVAGANSLRGELPAVEHWIHVDGGKTPEGYLEYEELMAAGSPEEPPAARPANRWRSDPKTSGRSPTPRVPPVAPRARFGPTSPTSPSSSPTSSPWGFRPRIAACW